MSQNWSPRTESSLTPPRGTALHGAVQELHFLKNKMGALTPTQERSSILHIEKIRANAPLWPYLQRALGIPAYPLMASSFSQYLKIAFLFIKKMPWKSK